jgi:hypothetical protein
MASAVGKTTARGANSASSALFDPDLYAFERNNEPNAEILLNSLRSTGYDLESVVGDIIDNAIDAEASTVVVNLEIDKSKDEWTVEVADDGFGMDESTLDQMMRLGSRSDHDLDTDLGAFGLGSDTAALGIGRNKHVITCHEENLWLSSMWDLDAIRKAKAFVKHLDAARPDEVELFADAFARAGVEAPSLGTLVRIGKCDRVGRRDLEAGARAVRRYVAQTFRRFLVPNGGLTIIVNGIAVDPFDPLMREDSETMVLFDEHVEFSWKDENGEEQTDKIGFVIVHLPDKGGTEANKGAGITIDGSGFYLMRNGREIVPATTLRLFARHNEYSRFRAEISLPARLDAHVGVTFLKSSADVKPSQALRDKIRDVTNPYRRQSQQLYRRSRKDAEEQVPHDEAAKHIKTRSPFLRKPAATIEKREKRGEQGASRKRGEPESGRTPRERAQRSLADQARFEAKQAGPHAPFYEGHLEGRRIVVTYNSDHPAYQRLILDNRENRGQVAAIDYLVWSLVAAELRNVDDENARFMEAMREDASFNLRQLLTA